MRIRDCGSYVCSSVLGVLPVARANFVLEARVMASPTRAVRYIAIAAFIFTLSGCAPMTRYSCYQAVDANPGDVKLDVDTKSTVRGRLGSPSATSTFDPNIWFYITQVKDRKSVV